MNYDQIAITSKYVMNKGNEIKQVIHDSDGDWQFLSDDYVTEEDALVVSLRQILEHDDSLVELIHSLPKNHMAYRDDKESSWVLKIIE